MHRVVLLIARPVLNRSIRRFTGNRYSQEQRRSLIQDGWRAYDKLRVHAPIESTVGARIMVELAVLSDAFYHELVKLEGSSEDAIEVFNQIAWDIYQKMGKIAWFLTGIRSNGEYEHLRNSIMAFRRFPFSSPSYGWKDLPGEKNEVVFNCTRCPVANYFKSKGLADLGYNTWCKYDYRLAELWGGKLELTNTIAGGADECDFKWTSNNN